MRVLETLTWAEITSALRAEMKGSPSLAARGASIDTRTLEAGDLFFAFKGEQADGHDFIRTAFERGAAGAVVQDIAQVPEGAFALVVSHPESALFELGRLIRSRVRVPFVAVTGSAGKTTAKDFTAELLAARGPVLATRGNLNNHLGVPLTLARLETDHWAAVIECGMSHPGELSLLAGLVRPRVAVITNVAAAHLEFFDSLAQIAEAKAEIFETLREGDFAVAPADEALLSLRAHATSAQARLFGDGERSSVRAIEISMSLEGSTFELHCDGAKIPVTLRVAGPHAVSNFLAAAAAASALGVPIEVIAERARLLKSAGNRGTVKRLGDDILLIDDSYNSNPKALRSAVETLALAKGRRRVACVGDMLELGASGPQLHREAGAFIGSRVDLLLGVGPLALEIVDGAASLPDEAKRTFATSVDLAANVASLVRDHDAVLVKGSRGVRMERVVEALMAAHPWASA
jgi:UDP-N-acetylmuramoyl-tripeptide--D-alanyl-D-alanine ligase